MKKRASFLGKSVYERDEEVIVRKSIPLSRTDAEKVKEYLENNLPPEINGRDENDLVTTFFRKAYEVMYKFKIKEVTRNEYVDGMANWQTIAHRHKCPPT